LGPKVNKKTQDKSWRLCLCSIPVSFVLKLLGQALQASILIIQELLSAPAHPCLLQNVVSIHNGILCSHEEEQNVIIRW
jgi:hypothetical protein